MAVAQDVNDSSRRNRVYDNIMRQWEQAASSPAPKPRSSHRRILGGQALPTRQVCGVGNMSHDGLAFPPRRMLCKAMETCDWFSFHPVNPSGYDHQTAGTQAMLRWK